MEEMCIWKVVEGERNCSFCSYYGGCEVRKKVITVEEIGGEYVSILSGIIGRNILERSRDRMLVWARNMVFYQLANDGYPICAIGRFMGFNHATVIYGKRQVENMLSFPGMYKEEYGVWLNFKKIIESCLKS